MLQPEVSLSMDFSTVPGPLTQLLTKQVTAAPMIHGKTEIAAQKSDVGIISYDSELGMVVK